MYQAAVGEGRKRGSSTICSQSSRLEDLPDGRQEKIVAREAGRQ
jgi:hypothetical protein